MRSRAIRVPVWNAVTSFNGRSAAVVNISRTGVLLVMDGTLPPGRKEGVLAFEFENGTRLLQCRVVRQRLEPPNLRETYPKWHVALEFIDSEERTAEVVRMVMGGQRLRRAS
ncbi:MAG: hypothetical protein QM736_03515 [Vicinamibacterales bacterium]